MKATTPDGSAWDAFGGAPDLALCIHAAGHDRCYPDGRSVGDIVRPACRDTLSCTIDDVWLPAGRFEVEVVDVDELVNDAVGRTLCTRGQTCRAGPARVSLE